ncbi:hypothetical protein AJ79_08969 [Helicocarpus griseus UAMH5409]|uniref:Uncharacterized protein n=1 Tax=Helicocarpus griseus UAMH5409 TaxID=1447875 RepID=A0A2B7WNG4_9EURO|nr:hypothetical protein AJ79_08969 [Helicocarpus griseus UAMH5409]
MFMRKCALSYFSAEEPVATVLVSAKRERIDDDSWLDACKKIREIFIRRELNDLSIEIIDSRATQFIPIGLKHTLGYWAMFNLKARWVALECFRRGTGDKPKENPVTIVLTIPYESRKQWKPIREAIVQILDSLSLPEVAVEIVRGEIWRSSDLPENRNFLLGNTENVADTWDIAARCGMGIGPYQSDASISTLGGFVELLIPGNGRKGFD